MKIGVIWLVPKPTSSVVETAMWSSKPQESKQNNGIDESILVLFENALARRGNIDAQVEGRIQTRER
jgi:hypothetical protein